MLLNLKRMDERAVLPKYGSEGAAAFDLYCLLDQDEIVIKPGETALLNTGWAMEIPEGYVGLICPRRGLGTKKGLILSNTLGVIDSDYRGNVMVSIFNRSKEPQTISNLERVAQMLIMPVVQVQFNEVEELSDTERGTGGFGHSGTK